MAVWVVGVNYIPDDFMDILFKAIKNCFSKSGFCLAMFTLVIAISALTNNPLSDTMIYMMFAFYAGLFFSDNIQTRRESS